MAYICSYGDGCGMLYIKILSLEANESVKIKKTAKYTLALQIWDREKELDHTLPFDKEINKSLIFDGIVYYGNTTINTILYRKRGCRGNKVEAKGSFRLLNCIYKQWMIERQENVSDTYGPVKEESEFTPNAPFLSDKDRIAYTLPFQRIDVPLLTSDNTILGTLHVISLFIPYSIRKPCESRPPLMHMATVIDDIPLLKRAVDVENRGELWNFRGFNPLTIALICRLKRSMDFLLQLKEMHSFELSEEAPMKNVFHYTAMCGDYHFLRIVMNAMPKKQDFPLMLSKCDEHGETPIFSAIRVGDYKMVQSLMKCGALLDVRNNDGNTPLMISIEMKQEPIALLFASLSRMGPDHSRVYYASPGAVNHKGQTALMLAAREGMLLLIRRLLHCQMSVLSIDSQGKTVLYYALQAKVNQMLIICALLNIPKTYDITMIDSKWIKSNHINVDLLVSTFYDGSIPGEICELCDPAVLELLQALMKHVEIPEKITFVEEDDLFIVCF